MKLKAYHRAQSINEVVSLVEKSKKNVILGGTHWLKMGKATYNMGIDVSDLGLDQIEETAETIEIGGYVSLRQLETDPLIKTYAPLISHAVSHIVGVQFRNTARLGASVFSKFGFSDVTTALLTMDSWVELNGEERIPLESYQLMPRQRHFITRIIIAKESIDFAYNAMRVNKTSLPYMIVATTRDHKDQWRIALGARPGKPMLAHKTMSYLNKGGRDIEVATKLMLDETSMADNVFASKDYRQHLSGVFLKKGVTQLWS